MKRFNLFGFAFALVFGCHINGVKSQTCNAGYYLNDKGNCIVLPYDDKSPVVKAIPGLGRCGAFDTTLKVRKYEYTEKVPQQKPNKLEYCQGLCQSDRSCTHFEYDDNNKNCSFIGKESFGTKEKNIVSGYGECPTTDKCFNMGADYIMGTGNAWHTNIKSPKNCQKLCRRKNGAKVFSYQFFGNPSDKFQRSCFCHDAHSFLVNRDKRYISGDSHCPRCFFYHIKLRNLPNVDNGGPNPYLIKPTVTDCQRSCKDNPNCTWFEFNGSNKECRHKNFITGEMKKKNVVYGSRDCSCDCNKNGAHGCGKDDVCHCKPSYQGPKCDQCVDEYYMPDRNAKICYSCNCSTTGTRNLNCDRTGQCNCYEDSYTGLKCDICVKGQIRTNEKCCYHNDWYDWSKRDCTDCNCHSVGSKSQQCSVKSGQCPCISKRHSGKQCNQCLSGYIWSNGYCCLKEYYYDAKKPGSCSPCDCYGPGSIGKVCSAQDGQCTCRSPYKGRRCDDVNSVDRRINTIYSQKSSIGKYYVVFEHYCNGNCDVLDLSLTTSYVDVDMYGSTKKFKSDFTSDGDTVCNGINGFKGKECCDLFSNQLSVDTFYVVLLSLKNFKAHGTTYKVKIGNYKGTRVLGAFNG